MTNTQADLIGRTKPKGLKTDLNATIIATPAEFREAVADLKSVYNKRGINVENNDITGLLRLCLGDLASSERTMDDYFKPSRTESIPRVYLVFVQNFAQIPGLDIGTLARVKKDQAAIDDLVKLFDSPRAFCVAAAEESTVPLTTAQPQLRHYDLIHPRLAEIIKDWKQNGVPEKFRKKERVLHNVVRQDFDELKKLLGFELDVEGFKFLAECWQVDFTGIKFHIYEKNVDPEFYDKLVRELAIIRVNQQEAREIIKKKQSSATTALTVRLEDIAGLWFDKLRHWKVDSISYKLMLDELETIYKRISHPKDRTSRLMEIALTGKEKDDMRISSEQAKRVFEHIKALSGSGSTFETFFYLERKCRNHSAGDIQREIKNEPVDPAFYKFLLAVEKRLENRPDSLNSNFVGFGTKVAATNRSAYSPTTDLDRKTTGTCKPRVDSRASRYDNQLSRDETQVKKFFGTPMDRLASDISEQILKAYGTKIVDQYGIRKRIENIQGKGNTETGTINQNELSAYLLTRIQISLLDPNHLVREVNACVSTLDKFADDHFDQNQVIKYLFASVKGYLENLRHPQTNNNPWTVLSPLLGYGDKYQNRFSDENKASFQEIKANVKSLQGVMAKNTTLDTKIG
jgi:hypothetical protein